VKEQVCSIHQEPLTETHPADVENGPHPHDVYNELVCPSCEFELAHAPAMCLKHQRDLEQCLPCLYADEEVQG